MGVSDRFNELKAAVASEWQTRGQDVSHKESWICGHQFGAWLMSSIGKSIGQTILVHDKCRVHKSLEDHDLLHSRWQERRQQICHRRPTALGEADIIGSNLDPSACLDRVKFSADNDVHWRGGVTFRFVLERAEHEPDFYSDHRNCMIRVGNVRLTARDLKQTMKVLNTWMELLVSISTLCYVMARLNVDEFC